MTTPGPDTGSDPGRKTHTSGTHRTLHPAETVARVRPHMAAMGITRVANVTGLDRIGVPVVMVTRPNARSVAVSQGKGLTLDAARASGLMEALEGWHAERMQHPLKLASFDELQPACPVIDVDRLPRVTDSRYRSSFNLLWIEALDVVSGNPLWVPYEMVHANYTLPHPTGHGCFPPSTNGLASGNHRLEALCHAICEVVERDSTTIWNHMDKARRDARRLDLDTVDDPACKSVLERLEDAGIAVAAWDTTTDVGIASFFCVIADARHQAHAGIGAGCHPAPEIALSRALTEAVQVRTTYITGSRDDLGADEFTSDGIAAKAKWIGALLHESEPQRAFADVPSFEGETFEDDLRWILDRLRAAGIREVAAVDLTRPEIGIPVMRAIVPGLEDADDHATFVPGPRAAAAAEGRL